MTDRIKEIENLLPDRLKNSLFSGMFGFRVTYDGLEEIRLRCAQPPEIRFKGKDYRTDKVIIAPQDIRQCLEYMSHYSLYAFQEEIRQGYLTVRGGHRIGVLGHAVLHPQTSAFIRVSVILSCVILIAPTSTLISASFRSWIASVLVISGATGFLLKPPVSIRI